jgi:hypothetical protein
MKDTNNISFRRLIIACAAWIVKAVFCLGCSSLLAQDAVPSSPRIVYRTAISVLSLPYGVAAQGGFAMLKGTVTLCNGWGLVVQDRTGGIWVSGGNYAPGDEIAVIGPVEPGRYSPQIASPHIRLIGHRPLPIPKTVSFRQLSSGQEDAQYVSIEGTIRAVSLRNDMPGFGSVALSIAMPEGRVDAVLSSQYEKLARTLIDAKVRITATALNRKNSNMQATGVVLAISDLRGVKVIQPGPQDLSSAPIIPIGSLMRYRSHTDYFHRVRLRGVLTYYEPGTRLMLQDGTQAIEVFLTDSPPLEIGDRIEAVGFPSPDDSGPVLRDAVLRQLTHGTPLAPVQVDALSSTCSFCLVSIDMRLLRIIDEPTRTLFLLEYGGQVTTAELKSHITVPPSLLAPGSTIRVSGINLPTGGTGLIYLGSPIPSNLLLRTLNDVSLITPGSWWTSTRLSRLAMVLGILTSTSLLLLMYVQLKRRKMETVLHEQERLARDIHDTLAQSFAGIGFQLQVIRKAVAVDDPSLMHHVDIARKLVQFSHREACRSLVTASSDDSSCADLLSSLKKCAQALAENGLIKIEADYSGIVRLLPGCLNAQLFHLGQEAIANAISHAEPTRLIISVDYQSDSVRLNRNCFASRERLPCCSQGSHFSGRLFA